MKRKTGRVSTSVPPKWEEIIDEEKSIEGNIGRQLSQEVERVKEEKSFAQSRRVSSWRKMTRKLGKLDGWKLCSLTLRYTLKELKNISLFVSIVDISGKAKNGEFSFRSCCCLRS